MLAFQKSFTSAESLSNMEIDFNPDLFLIFISPLFPDRESFLKELSRRFPDAIITGCSTSGEIIDISVDDKTVVLNALKFEDTRLKMLSSNVIDFPDCIDLGKDIIGRLEKEDLKHVLVFSEGLMVNGDDLVTGLTSGMNSAVGITGGMAGDGTDFNNTFVIKNDKLMIGEVVIVGMYGKALNVGYSSVGGWNSFGIERKVTRSDKNILYEIDGQPALQLYKSFLGDKAEDLPGSGLLFPLSLRLNETSKPLVRTLLSIDEKEQSIIFAGNIPEGSFVRLMKANVDRLISGAEESALRTKDHMKEEVDFALLVSCVGRRVVLKQLVEEEVEAVRDVLGDKPVISGFYSYGELAPFGQDESCKLHNQTMTITTFSESV